LADLQKYELVLEDILRDVAVCSHVANCKILNCPHRLPHSSLTCPIMGTPRRIFSRLDECPLNPADGLRCLKLDTLAVVYEEHSL
jgi:hypothetical protein